MYILAKNFAALMSMNSPDAFIFISFSPLTLEKWECIITLLRQDTQLNNNSFEAMIENRQCFGSTLYQALFSSHLQEGGGASKTASL